MIIVVPSLGELLPAQNADLYRRKIRRPKRFFVTLPQTPLNIPAGHLFIKATGATIVAAKGSPWNSVFSMKRCRHRAAAISLAWLGDGWLGFYDVEGDVSILAEATR